MAVAVLELSADIELSKDGWYTYDELVGLWSKDKQIMRL